jgi:hypothetical protein
LQLKDLIASIFVAVETRISMNELINHPWLNEGFSKPIDVVPCSPLTIDSDIINKVEIQFGFKHVDVYNSIFNGEKNQFSMTYWIIKQRKELLSQTISKSN